MNQRIVSALVLAGMIASSSAFASNARNLVMFQGGAGAHSAGGSFYYEDAYNFFYNPAYVNDYKNWAIIEKGTGDDAASFGFVSSMMNFNMGLFFNRNALVDSSNAVDLMIGGDAGVKWGLGLTYGSESVGGTKSKDLVARVGASFAGLDPFLSFQILGDDKTGSTKVNKYTDMRIGARYHYGEWTPYVAYRMDKVKAEATGAETKNNTLTLGLGRETKLAEGARLVYAAYYQSTKNEVATGKTTNWALPIEMSIEADAVSWLTVRGGVQHQLASNQGTEETLARIGGTFHVGKVDLDYAFGNSKGLTAATGEASDSADVGFDSETFHQIGMRYSW